MLGSNNARQEESRRYLESRAHELGLELTTPSVIANSHRALLLAEYTRDQGRFDQVHQGIFRAYFAEGRNIGETEVLRDVAAGAGLDPDQALEAIGDPAGSPEARLERSQTEGAALGINGTPTFIVADRYAIVGAQPYDWLRDALQQINDEISGEEPDG